PPADGPGPYAPRDRHVRLSPRPVVWSRQRRGRSSAVSHPCAPWPSLCHPPPSLPKPAVPRPSPDGTPVTSASPLLNGMSRARGAVLRAAPAGCRGALGARAAGGASSGHRRARGACDRGGGAKMPFILPIRELLNLVLDQTPTASLLVLLTCRPHFQP